MVTEETLPYIPDGHLVCVRGMLQDMFDSELFMASYRHKGEENCVAKSTRYRDIEYLTVSIHAPVWVIALLCLVNVLVLVWIWFIWERTSR